MRWSPLAPWLAETSVICIVVPIERARGRIRKGRNGQDGGMARPHRPGPARWIWYAFGGSLGRGYREWVLHDVTCRTRWLRQVARATVPLVPFAVLMFVIVGAGWITWAALMGGLVMALISSAAYIDQTAEHRLTKHGYPPGTAERVRRERDGVLDPE